MIKITAADIENWKPRSNKIGGLPVLLRRLIKASNGRINRIEFPSGDNVTNPGWDGILEAGDSSPYFPDGTSLWELGTTSEMTSKANEDYQKRTDEPIGFEVKKSSFIFATTGNWTQKQTWINEKKADNLWREVRALDSNDLENWIENHPGISLWLAEELGKIDPSQTRSAYTFWEEWTSHTDYKFSVKILTSGRQKETEQIIRWAINPSKALNVQGPSKEEALTFLFAALAEANDDVQTETFFSRCLLVYSAREFLRIVNSGTNLILIPLFDDVSQVQAAISKGHSVYLPLDNSNTAIQNKIDLPKLEIEGFIAGLVEMGMTKEEADQLCTDSGKDILTLRRLLNYRQDQPTWATEAFARELIPAMMLGQWEEHHEQDKLIVSKLAQLPYSTYSGKLGVWLQKGDSPLRKIGGMLKVIAPQFTWRILAPFLAKADLELFKEIALEVLCSQFEETDDLTPLTSRSLKFSGTLVSGICDSLILIAAYGESDGLRFPEIPQTWVDNIIREVFTEDNFQTWIRLNPVLDKLAEASPDQFMSSLDASLKQTDAFTKAIFVDKNEGSLFPTAFHPRIVWSLEKIAWDEKYFGRAAELIAKLCELDPGGRLSNRPSDCLERFFLLNFAQTVVKYQGRLDVLSNIIKRHSEVAFYLLQHLLNGGRGFMHLNIKPSFRFSPKQFPLHDDRKNVKHFFDFITLELLKLAQLDAKRLSALIRNMYLLPPEKRTELCTYLRQKPLSVERDQEIILVAIRESLYWANTSKHNYSEDDLTNLNTIYILYESSDLVKRYLWLFNEVRPKLVSGESFEKSNNDYLEAVNEKRLIAINEIFQSSGLKGISDFAQMSNSPFTVGAMLAQSYISKDSDDDRIILELLSHSGGKITDLIKGFVALRSRSSDLKWLDHFYEQLKDKGVSESSLVLFLLSINLTTDVYTFIEQLSPSIKEEYWTRVPVNWISNDTELANRVIEKLVSANRFTRALKIVVSNEKTVPTEILLTCLYGIGTTLPLVEDEGLIVDAYEIERCFKVLEDRKIDEFQLAMLELKFLDIFNEWQHRWPIHLHKVIFDDPSIFIQFFSSVYGPKNEQTDITEEPNEKAKLLAERSFSVLWNLKIPIEYSTNPTLLMQLKNWVKEVRELASSIGRLDTCDSYLGQILATYPENSEEWPPDMICEIIETHESESLKNGFHAGVRNKRGITTRHPLAGGKQERDMATKYDIFAAKLVNKHSLVASLLRDVAYSYHQEGKRHDSDSDRTYYGW